MIENGLIGRVCQEKSISGVIHKYVVVDVLRIIEDTGYDGQKQIYTTAVLCLPEDGKGNALFRQLSEVTFL